MTQTSPALRTSRYFINSRYSSTTIQRLLTALCLSSILSTMLFSVAAAAAPEISVSPNELIFVRAITQTNNSPAKSIVITNTGDATLRLNSAAIAGTQRRYFIADNWPSLPRNLAPGATATFNIRFNPTVSPAITGALSATLQISSNDADEGTLNIGLYGLSQASNQGGNDEPPLRWVLDTLGYPINVGGNNLVIVTNPNSTTPIGEEVTLPLFERVGTGSVSIQPVARYSPREELPFGYYRPGTTPQRTTLGTLADVSLANQTLFPPMLSGATSVSFNPGTASFGLFVDSASFNRITYSQDSLNTGTNRTLHAVRIFPLKNRAGQLVPNSYLVCFEDATNGDFQDYVFVISNVAPAGTANANATATANANATATANADATATANANATANADATATANANATATANADATATANADATATANADATATANADATATAQAQQTATANANATATSNAEATTTAQAQQTATANANATATANADATTQTQQTATANANATATATAQAQQTATANANATATANADATAQAQQTATANANATATTQAQQTTQVTSTPTATPSATATVQSVQTAPATVTPSATATATTQLTQTAPATVTPSATAPVYSEQPVAATATPTSTDIPQQAIQMTATPTSTSVSANVTSTSTTISYHAVQVTVTPTDTAIVGTSPPSDVNRFRVMLSLVVRSH